MISLQDPTYPLFPVLSLIGGILCLIPLPWHIQAWNSGTCAFMFWTALACLINSTNSIIWHGNVNNPAPVWCDISSKIIIGVSVAIPAATLCISRRLYYLTSGKMVSITPEDKRRMVLIDIGLSVGIPVIIMVLHYVVQGHRFDILEDIGCYPVVYNTLLAYFLYYGWPVVIGCISFVFSALTLRSFWIRRVQFSQFITSKSSMSVSHYFRLVLLSGADITCTLPFALYSIYVGTKGVTLAPWISWEDTHFNFSRVGLVPSMIWRTDPYFRTSVELTRWLPVICAFLFFALFGFASEAKRHYKLAFWGVLKSFGVRPASKAPIVDVKGNVKASLPRWTKPQQLDTLSSSVASLPTFVTSKAQVSPSTSSFGPKKGRSYSFSTSTSASAGDGLELHSIDIEKSAGLTSRLSEASTMTCYASPPPGYSSRPQPPHVPMDVSVAEADNIEDIYLPPSPLPKPESEAADTLRLPVSTPPPERKQSNSSMRSITSPDRDRFYIPSFVTHLSSNEDMRRAPSPPSPPPFARTTIATLNADDQETRRSPHVIQVMVQKTETQCHEEV